MISNVSGISPAPQKYTVKDVYAETAKMLKDEMQALKTEPLNEKEEARVAALAQVMSQTVLREMKIL